MMLFKKELYVTLDYAKYVQVTQKLREARIEYVTRIKDNLARNSKNGIISIHAVSPLAKDGNEYYIYVAKKDLDKARFIINQK